MTRQVGAVGARRSSAARSVGRVQPRGPKIAEGRDSEIYAHGPGRVLRRARDGRSLVAEAQIMSFARTHGFPTPEVFDAGDGYLVMERVDGPTLLDHAIPWRIGASAALLADLHQRLHRLVAPGWLPSDAPVPGECIVHGDLHPLNVIVGPDGPVVIDWANAMRGPADFDVADTWVLLACSDPPMTGIERIVAPVARRYFLWRFLRSFDRQRVRAVIPVAAQRRSADANSTDAERDRMRALARWANSSVS